MANKAESKKEEIMRRSYQWWAVVLILASLQAAACTQKADMPIVSKPAKVERVQGADLSRVTLSPKAAQPLDIKTASVRDEQIGSRNRLVAGVTTAKPTAPANTRRGRPGSTSAQGPWCSCDTPSLSTTSTGTGSFCRTVLRLARWW